MKWLIWLIVPLFLCTGCAAGIHSSLVDADVRLASPALGWGEGRTLPVVYPAGPVYADRDLLVESFGPAWESLEPVYSEYRFNPFNP